MKSITLTRGRILTFVSIWFAVFVLITLTNFNAFQIQNIVCFSFLAIVPGLLTVLAIELEGLNFFGYVGFIIGFSILELMISALIGNMILPFVGVARPLDKLPLLFDLYALVSFLGIALWYRLKEIVIPLKRFVFLENPRDVIISAVPIFFVLLSIGGAIRLNNGASNILTMVMLGLMGIYLAVLIYYAEKLDENTLPTAIFLMALSLLLMTSLRGWFITGHDIQREFKVFELAKTSGLWNVASFQNSYNACLSITILPTVFSNFLNIADQYVFKFFFQIFFALTPVFVYLIGRNWVNRQIALLGTIYFIGFPTFFTDMPFLNRQEIAFLFYGLMLYIIFQPELNLRLRRSLFLFMGIGVVLSHYSTTYVVLIIFGLAIVARPFFVKIFGYLQTKKLFSHSALKHLNSGLKHQYKITLSMIVFLLVLSFVWTSLITKTGNNVTSVITGTLSAIENGFGNGNRAGDAISLLSFGQPDPNQELQNYVKQTIDPILATSSPGEFYPPQAYAAYNIVGVAPVVVPSSTLTEFLYSIHINVNFFLTLLGQLVSKLTEAFVPIGILYLLFRKNIVERIDTELYLIAIVSLAFVGMNIVLPVLSVQYGIYRALQQSMFVISPIIVIGSICIGRFFVWLGNLITGLKFSKKLRSNQYKIDIVVASFFSILFFFYSTSFIPQIFGGSQPALHLNNSGVYYDDFYVHDQEEAAVNWVIESNSSLIYNIQTDVQSDRFSSNKISSISDLDPVQDIYPSIVRVDAALFLDYANVIEQRASELYSGDRIAYSYPLEFIDKNKDLIYSNGGSDIYQ